MNANTMKALDLINLAKRNEHKAAMRSSAALNIQEAVEHYELGNMLLAKRSAIRSLKYSLGILHAEYIAAVAVE